MKALLCFDLIKKITAYIREKRKKDATHLSVTTIGGRRVEVIEDDIEAMNESVQMADSNPLPA